MAGDYTRMLDYSIGGGPMIWRSPLWMLLAWEVVAVQFGYIGLGLWERFGKTDLLMIGLLGAINIPFYERDGAPNSLVVAIQRPGFRRSGSQADVLFALTEVQFPH